jgi:ubiquinone/menaquinone biosynthesis C-methylase UbiE
VRGLPTQRKKPHKHAVSAAFGAIAPFYDDWYNTPVGRYVWTVETSAINALLPDQNTGVALEIGVGTGMAIDILKPVSSSFVGVDISWQMLQHAYEKTKAESEVHLLLADGDNLPLRKQVVTLAMGMTVIEFVPDPKTLLLETRRVLHPNGHLILGVLTSTNQWALERKIRNFITPDVFSYAKFPTPWQIKRWLHKSGFSVCSTRGSVYASSFSPKGWLNQLAQLDEVFGTRWLTRAWGAFYCILACLPQAR